MASAAPDYDYYGPEDNHIDDQWDHLVEEDDDLSTVGADDDGLLLGPGHGSVATTPDGVDWFVYHAWVGPPSNIEMYPPGRVVNIDRIEWSDDGWPWLLNGVPSDTLMPAPDVCPSDACLPLASNNTVAQPPPPSRTPKSLRPTYKGPSDLHKAMIRFRNDICWVVEVLTVNVDRLHP